MADDAVRTISSREQLSSLLSSTARVILNCHAPWAAPCAQINTLMKTLSTRPTSAHDTSIAYARVEPERVPGVLKAYKLRTVPTVLFFSSGRVVRRIEGADAGRITTSARWLSSTSDEVLLRAACEVAVGGDVVVAMKGSPQNPRCGFCKDVVEMLRTGGVVFEHVDVAGDVAMREMLKKVYEWSSYPMVFARGRLVGGLERVREVADAGLLVEELAEGGVVVKERLEERLTALVNRERVMLFMKGNPQDPRCGFSRKMVGVLGEQGIEFGSFDVLEDERVRQGLKKFSDWPTFPQLYSGGVFVGGLDVVNELVETGELKKEMRLE